MARNIQVLCNKCGKKVETEYEPFFSVNTAFGYGTPYDGDELQLDLCFPCMEELFESCVINPIIIKNNINNGE